MILRRLMQDAPGAMILGVYVLVSFVGVCLYWQFGTNVWVKIGLAPGWILSVVGMVNVALVIDEINR